MRQLPTYYYLTHFHEFLSFVEGPCADLLHSQHTEFLRAFHNASKDEQCALVRCINRKHTAVKISSLRFAELPNIKSLIEQLIQRGWLAHPQAQDMDDWLACLTKDELFEVYQCCADANAPTVNKSAAKSVLFDACSSISAQSLLKCEARLDYVIRLTDPIIDYFLFLYFGNTKSRLNQFSLRDLGIMNTREERAQMQSRFDCKEAALSSFLLSKYLSKVRRHPLGNEDSIRELLLNIPEVQGIQAQDKYNNIVFELAKALLEFDTQHALDLLLKTDSPLAQEKWCREAYKAGHTSAVKSQLEAIIDNPLSDGLLHFAEDFLARKFKQKRTSVLTDMLREGNQHLYLDEIYKGSVERGVVAHYQQQNTHQQKMHQQNEQQQNEHPQKKQAFRTENVLWRSLFGLVFWQELFEIPGLGLATQFDFMPTCLKQNTFFESAEQAINDKLAQFNSADALMQLLSKQAARYYGKGQGIFHWRSNLLELLGVFVKTAPMSGIKTQLLRMAKDWQSCHDGFPDIMVLEQGKLHFEEIKSEGDVLRRNQLACIKSLRDSGFDVRITTVDFIIDPNQTYVVVDIETTGGRAAQHKITEIGMVKMRCGEIIDRWQSLINPQRRIPANITALTGIDDTMVQDAPIFAELAEQIDAFTEGCIFVAHNVNFDYGFIKEEFSRIERFWRRPKLCTVQQMRRYYKGLPSYSLANLTRHFDIGMQRHHRAMSDAVAASELLKLINEKRFTTSAE
ncbi:exonuclease domain-containing protein [Glaciecola siphonariae]|uniref:DNA-directed DNA polymerase n=1 Tax=Glaciecola siphonariae TaxID=521012 RepID=A0ABV9LQE2_9ALTE